MIKDIISGVCKKLTDEFCKDGKYCKEKEIKIYTENSERKTGTINSKSSPSLRQPNFYVSCKNPPGSQKAKERYFTNTQLLGNRYLQSVALCVECRWFPDWQDVLDRMYVCLEYIPVGDSVVRGTAMQGEYSDDLLSFFVSYDAFVYYEDKDGESNEKMEKLELKEEFTWH